MPLAQPYEQARIHVEQLVERFDRNLDLYKRPSYKEARVRVEFIDPFFEALGWDVRNVEGRGEHDKDVIHEDVVRIGGKPRAPDYSFRIGQKRRFFVEAKKPAVSLKSDVAPALQLRRYSWTAKLPLGLLTDFEEFAIYDCRFRPAGTDKASVGCIEYITFDSYLDRFDDIYGLFAKPSVREGSLDQYAQEKAKRGSSEVDAELLKEIDGWREELARNIALRNPGLSVHELNDAVQRTIDRIIFLRMAEDRGIEEYKRLFRLTGEPQIYARMAETLYRQADAKYNSGLFDFEADRLSATLHIDDRVLKPILTSLYYPQSPYEFSVLPVEILGQVYEQFLGKVIRLTPAHRAKVEEKPEVRKAGGVYYTPSYIVDYIVEQTVGKLVEGKSPRQLRGVGGKPPLRVLDPACGSGSFLLGAYQYLLHHYLHWYEENDPERHARSREPAVYQGAGRAWSLTTAEKKRILLDHIFGVDIDRQAVEVTKLSLLLKVLEDETQETLGQQLSLWQERALPDLKDNIKCGNSLIGPDYFEGQLIVDAEEYRRVNPFDWQREFPQVFLGSPLPEGEGPGVRETASEGRKPLPPALLARVRALRRNATDAEQFLWSLLRNRQLAGLKFRRQHPLGGYILDFYCHEAQLGIELDGGQHAGREQAAYDAQRTRDLEELGVRVLRFWNNDVLTNPEGVAEAILDAVQGPHPKPLSQTERGSGAELSPLPTCPQGRQETGPGVRETRGEGGFDAVIGNPPYGASLTAQDKSYVALRFASQSYQFDSYLLFLERCVRSLVAQNGYYGMIIPNPWLTNLRQGKIRRFIMTATRVVQVVHFRFAVFPKVTVDTEIVVLQKSDPLNWEPTAVVVDSLDSFLASAPPTEMRRIQHKQDSWRALDGGVINIFLDASERSLAKKCRLTGVTLESLFDINVGIKPYQTGKGIPAQTRKTVQTRPYDSDSCLDPPYRQYLRGGDIRRFEITPIESRYIKYGPWLAEPRPSVNWDAPAKIVMRQTGDSLVAALDTDRLLCLNNMHVLCPKGASPAIEYVLGVANARLMNWYYHSLNPEVGEALAEVKKTNVARLPIRTIDLDDPADVTRHDRMIALVERMLDLHKKLAAAAISADKELYQRQIEATDRHIDALVYELYGLTEEEIAIVEGAAT